MLCALEAARAPLADGARAVEDDRAGGYGEVARALGLTELRITQVAALLGLSPAVQEGGLLGEGRVGIREAIRAARDVEWERKAV